MATFSNTPRPAYVWDADTSQWYPIGTGAHSHTDIPLATATAKGDLIAGTGSAAVTNRTVGADGSMLIADSTQASGLNWAGTMQYAGKNFQANGGFDFWQRGTTFASPTNQYTADRFAATQSAAGTTWSVSQTASFMAGSRYAIRTQRTSGQTGTPAFFLGSALETVDAIQLQGKTVTWSYYIKAGALYSGSGGGLGVQFNYGTGTDQGPFVAHTGEVALVNTIIVISTTATRYQHTFTVPSNATSIRWNFAWSTAGTAGATDYYDVTNMQIEISAVATPFSRAGGSQQAELALCQRYFYKTYDQSVAPGTANDNGVIFGCRPNGGAYLQGIHKSTMRVAPTVTAYSPATGTSGKVRNYSSAADENASTGFLGENNAKFAGTTGSNDLMGVHYTASAEL